MNHTYLDKQVNIYYADTKTVKSCENLHLEELFKKEFELFEPDANNSSCLLCKNFVQVIPGQVFSLWLSWHLPTGHFNEYSFLFYEDQLMSYFDKN